MTYLEDLNLVQVALGNYLDDSSNRSKPVLKQMKMARLVDDLGIEKLIEKGGLHGERLTQFLDVYLNNTIRMQHPAYMGHQVAVPHPSGILGSLIDAFTNNPMAIYEMGPAAATTEFAVINWMLKKIGWSPSSYPGQSIADVNHGAGVLTHGGSLAQLTALAAARSHADPDQWENGTRSDLVVIAPSDSHYSVARSLGILGLGTGSLVGSPCDQYGRIIPGELAQTISKTKEDGKQVMAVVANACSTAAGLYDDLSAIGDVCEAHHVWLHVDGAHGASALLSDTYRHLLKGIEKASSVIWDAHKMMRTPGLCAAVLFKDNEAADQTFNQQASYIFHDKEQVGFDAIGRTVECTKAGLGLKFFMGLAAEGESGLAEYIDYCFNLAQQAAELINEHPDFELAIAPQANIVCFRFKDLGDDEQLQLRKFLLSSEESYITTTEFAGRRWLRFTFMNPNTSIEDVRHTLHVLREVARVE